MLSQRLWRYQHARCKDAASKIEGMTVGPFGAHSPGYHLHIVAEVQWVLCA